MDEISHEDLSAKALEQEVNKVHKEALKYQKSARRVAKHAIRMAAKGRVSERDYFMDSILVPTYGNYGPDFVAEKEVTTANGVVNAELRNMQPGLEVKMIANSDSPNHSQRLISNPILVVTRVDDR